MLLNLQLTQTKLHLPLQNLLSHYKTLSLVTITKYIEDGYHSWNSITSFTPYYEVLIVFKAIQITT